MPRVGEGLPTPPPSDRRSPRSCPFDSSTFRLFDFVFVAHRRALAPVLAAGPLVARQIYDPAAADRQEDGDLDIADVGRDAKMPWEADGRRWHTQDRVGRRGEPCRWDGRILERVVDRIHELGEFSETDWNTRSVVEISAKKKTDGWFFHAITGETWLLKMKFRVSRGAFRREELIERLNLKTLNQMENLPVYGNEPRVRCKTLRGPWQEVEIRAHTLDELDTPTFWSFLETAVRSFQQLTRTVDLEDVMPWKKLGQRWHLMRKGFAPGKRVAWDERVLEQLVHLLEEIAPGWPVPMDQPGSGPLHSRGPQRALGHAVHQEARVPGPVPVRPQEHDRFRPLRLARLGPRPGRHPSRPRRDPVTFPQNRRPEKGRPARVPPRAPGGRDTERSTRLRTTS